MIRKLFVAALASTALSAPAFAQDAADDTANGEDTIIVTAARTILPPSALPWQASSSARKAPLP